MYDALIENKRYWWVFTLKDGSEVYAPFTKKEIEEFKKLYPEVKWKTHADG